RAHIQGTVEAFSSGPKGLVEPAFQDFSGRQLCQVLGDPNAASLELKQFDVLVGLAGTEDETQRRSLSRLTFVPFEPAKVELHLALVGSPKPTQFQVHSEQSVQATMEEKQVQVVILIVNRDSLLAGDEA